MTAQLILFPELPAPPARGVTWQRHPMPPFTNYEMLNDGIPNGVWIRHCGHQTALRPYYVVAPNDDIIERKFRRLEEAKLAATMVAKCRYSDEAWLNEMLTRRLL